ncbi:FtsX-like permease family protein [Hahella ganghwensis]|uniref:FtsX-like permease family protein n=1 Tax=Hahella ganghwensis TaxID=286420 RepID=UPI0003825201|nr:FtsX-like permease family protein [Hahella ganghwensis]
MLNLALRNIWRNPRRSIITLAAIAVGVWALIFIWAFIDGMNEQMIVNNIQYLSGHIKIHRQGYHQNKVLALSIPASQSLDINQISGVTASTARVEATALVSSQKNSSTVLVFGVDPDTEREVTTLHKTLISGRYLSGQPLEVVVGDNLARDLNVDVGETLDLIVQASDGSIGADRFHIVGLLNTGIDKLDENLLIIPIGDAQELYSLWGQYTSWVIRLVNRQEVEDTAEKLAAQLGAGYEILPWFRLLPSVVQAVEFHEAVAYVVLLVVFVVVAAGIANTLLMSVLERMREFGVMRALGTQSLDIVLLVQWESILLAVLGLIIGNVLGIGFTGYWAREGIDLSMYTEAMETMPGLSGIVYPLMRVDHILLVSAVVFIVCIVPAQFPAWRASQLDPVQAIRGIAPRERLAGWMERLIHFPANMLWLRLAWRNLFRNPKRSFLTGGATAFGMAAFIFLYAFADGFFEQMITNSTQLLSGHVQVSAGKSGRKETVIDRRQIPNQLTLLPEVEATSIRLIVQAIAGSAQKSLPVEWVGVEPEPEKQVTRLHTLINRGSYLSGSKLGREGIVIGQTLAKDLEVEVGHRIVITAQDSQGQLLSVALRVIGIYYSGSELFDRGYVFTSIDQVRKLFGYGEQDISHLAVRLVDRHYSQSVAAQMNQQLMGTEIKAHPWETLMPVLVQMVEMTRVDFYLVLAVIFVVVGIGVMNTMLMSVLERTREFGVLLALGTTPRQVLITVLYEALILGVLGIVLGAVVGILLAQYYHVQGIDLSAFFDSMAAIPGMTDKVFPVLIAGNLIIPTILLYILGALVSVYPAIKASRLRPKEALHGH